MLSQRVITSPVIKIEDLIKSFLSGEFVTTNYIKFMDAILKGDYDTYKPNDNHEIYPIFQSDSKIRQSPLLKLRILSLLYAVYTSTRTVEEKHLEVQSIVEYFEAINNAQTAVESALTDLFTAGLVETFDTSIKELSMDRRLAITHRGIVHLRLASHNGVFFYQMALTTAIVDHDTAEKIRAIHKSNKLFREQLCEVKELFLEYLLQEDQQFTSIGIELPQYQCQRDLINSLSKFKQPPKGQDNELVATLGENYKEGIIKTGVIAIVDWYDASKGFGFAEVDEIEGGIFFHAATLEKYNIQIVSDGDGMLCDIARNEKGFIIEKIHDIERDTSQIETVECEIIRLFPDRQYGFVKIIGSQKDAFFHTSVFPYELRKKLKESQKIRAEIGPDKDGTGFQVKRILA